MLRRFGVTIEKCTEDDLSRAKKVLSLLRPLQTNFGLIRIGSDTDGGYLIPNVVHDLDVCFSPGTSNIVHFERELIEKYDIHCHCLDASVSGVNLPDGKFTFTKKFLGPSDSSEFISLDSWVAQTKTFDNGILQIDIERWEWEVFAAVSRDTLNKFRVICVEFHDLHHLFHRSSGKFYDHVISRLLKNHIPVHAHVNNCRDFVKYRGQSVAPVMEITFLRRDSDVKVLGQASLPNDLDKDCVPGRKTQDIREIFK